MKVITLNTVAIYNLLQQKGGMYLSCQQISNELNIHRKSVSDSLKHLRRESVVEMLDIRPTPFYRIHPELKYSSFVKEIERVRDGLKL
ncbi:MAG: hypothetical protein KME29_15480 [Calothrix sp. FI2-JRJ7]|jgi:biotin operon repressor|nr:hypothetical protein [Calothrix sp. FI2-JRJ7]